MTPIPILILTVTGPLQSWGIQSRWNVRDTSSEPTKSGIVGLFACALGYKSNDIRIEMELDQYLKIGVRIDRPGIVTTDFHTVMGEHTIATGNVKLHTELTYRSYIEDASFVIAVSGPKNLLHKIQMALRRPKWPIYLGRKSCVPTTPVLGAITDEFSSIKEALETIPWTKLLPKEEMPQKLRCIIESEDEGMLRNDLRRVNPARIYGTRRVVEYWVSPPLIQQEK